MNCECWPFSKSQTPFRNTVFLSGTLQKSSISVGVRGTEVLATTETSDVKPGHGTKALIWGTMWEVEKVSRMIYYVWVTLATNHFLTWHWGLWVTNILLWFSHLHKAKPCVIVIACICILIDDCGLRCFIFHIVHLLI